MNSMLELQESGGTQSLSNFLVWKTIMTLMSQRSKSVRRALNTNECILPFFFFFTSVALASCYLFLFKPCLPCANQLFALIFSPSVYLSTYYSSLSTSFTPILELTNLIFSPQSASPRTTMRLATSYVEAFAYSVSFTIYLDVAVFREMCFLLYLINHGGYHYCPTSVAYYYDSSLLIYIMYFLI